MTRNWADIQSREQIILQMRQQGRNQHLIANALNFDKEQIKNGVKWFNRKQAQTSVTSKRKGRPRKRPITEPQVMAHWESGTQAQSGTVSVFFQAVERCEATD